MSVSNTKYVYTLEDRQKTKLCAFCGKPVKVIPKEDTTGNVRDWCEWNEYECSCAMWQKYENLYAALEELNAHISNLYTQYEDDRSKLIAEANLSPGIPKYVLSKKGGI